MRGGQRQARDPVAAPAREVQHVIAQLGRKAPPGLGRLPVRGWPLPAPPARAVRGQKALHPRSAVAVLVEGGAADAADLKHVPLADARDRPAQSAVHPHDAPAKRQRTPMKAQ